MHRTAHALVFLLAALQGVGGAAGQSPAAPPPASPAVATFPLSQVRLLDGPFKASEALNLGYVHTLEVDRLVAPYRKEAGLPPKGEPYPNWESTGLQGHTAGHYLTALAQAWAATGDAEAKRRLDYLVAELAACQRANGDGYVGAVPKGRAVWQEIAGGTLRVESFALNGAWVPWYNLHKLFAGLRDAHLIGGSDVARSVLVGLTDWTGRLLARLSDAQVQQMLGAEHGGMNEVLADVFALTGERRYLALAERLSHRALLDPLLRREDTLTRLHANTQIPKAIGYARIADLGGDPAWRDAAVFFWDQVVRRRTVAFGGNSVREHFNPIDDFGPMLESREGPETCNTYNMLRLTERLFATDAAAHYADYYERALFNHILSTQHPVHGGYVYFTPIRPRHYRVYSQPSQCFWCCVGTGIENHGRHGQFVYARSADTLYVNLFVASEVTWPERGLRLRQETAFPDQGLTSLALRLDAPRTFRLRLRRPGWAGDGFRVRVNGAPVTDVPPPSSYVAIAREWRDGDRVDVDLPMRTTIEPLPGDGDYVAILHGPILLAAKTGAEQMPGLVAGDGRMAHVSTGPYLPLDAAPMLVGDRASLAAKVRPLPGAALTFTARDVLQPRSARALRLVPFFRVHDSRYMIYWRAVGAADYERVVARLREEERARLALEARTLDAVAPGEQQPEVEHNLRSDGSTTGVTHGRRWREATGFFSYDLRTGGARGPLDLRVTYLGGDRGRRFEVLAGDRAIASVSLDGRAPDRFEDVIYPVPADVVASAPGGVLTVRFAARPGSRTGGVYDVRLLRP